MRLLKFISKDDFSFTKDLVGDDKIPPYAILSHTWKDGEEVTFEELTNHTGRGKTGYEKIWFCGEQAKRDGLQYFWVDTCCIDKSNQVEIQDAINSMFRWYQNATECYVFLSVVSITKRKASSRTCTWNSAFQASRWFTRGWTLQELLAPHSVKFFSVEGKYLGEKGALKRQISEITGIPTPALQGTPLYEFSVEERFSWIKHRQTTRKEDKAYALLGIFSIHIPLNYGEGEENAFQRLRRKIRKHPRSLLQHASIQPGKEDRECIRDLRLNDPRDDKKRIEDTKGGLLRDSYRWILENADFQQWRDDEQHQLLWIKGDPGKGKTMLLCGIIDELKESKAKADLLSFYFCQATDSRINNATAVLRGLLYILVEQQPSLVSHIQKRYELAGKALFEDANAWFALAEIFTNVLQDPSLSNMCLIIDALDECVVDLERLLEFVAQHSASSRAKWIVSSRNWPEIEEHLERAGHKIRLSLELNTEVVSMAVARFIENKVSQLAQQKRYDKRTRDAARDHLVSNANGTFLWVALVCQSLKTIPRWNVRATLIAFPPGLDSLYERMMQQINGLDNAEMYKQILASAAIVYRPITLRELASLVELLEDMANDLESIREIISLCGSFLTIREDTIYFVHQSAKDFLLEKASEEVFPFGKEYTHRHTCSRSLQVLSRTLQRDIYSLGAVGYRTEQIEQLDLDSDPLAASRYSCVYWVDHLSDSVPAFSMSSMDHMQAAIAMFIEKKYLYWLEALSLCRSISKGVASMTKLEELMLIGVHAPLTELVQDARRFIAYHKRAIESSPLQTHEEPDWVAIKPAAEDKWSACLQTLEGHSEFVSSVVFSHNSTWLASGSYDRTVKIWDAGNGECVQTLKGHSDTVSSVTFSHDSTWLASGSSDRTVKIWDASSGRCLQTLEGHSDIVESVTFSHDSTWLASGSNDSTVKIWDASSGRCLQTLEGHSDTVSSVTFSHDSTWLASGAYDRTVKIWNAGSGECLKTLEGFSEWACSVAFTHDSTRLASALGYKVAKIWNMYSGECLQTLEGHSAFVTSATFSHNSTWLVTGSYDRTVKIWDADSGKCLQTFKGHSEFVNSVAFSHDSTRLASASGDRTIKIWDVDSSDYLQTLKGHSSFVCSVAFSHNSTRLASASGDGTVIIWDAGSGEYLQTLKGHSNIIRAVTFSHDSSWLASGSDDKTIKIWDASSGECLRTLKDNSFVYSVTFSYDSTRLASTSDPGIIKIWDANNGACLQTLKGHSREVGSVAFSHNSAWLASASEDRTAKIWDPGSGECLQTFEVGKSLRDISFNITDSCLHTEIGTIDISTLSDSIILPSTLEPYSPCNPGLAVSLDGVWITSNSENLVWLPSEYRPKCLTRSGNAISIGVGTGRVWICTVKLGAS